MPDTTPTAPIGVEFYATPVKEITPVYLPETSGPILHLDDMVVEALHNSEQCSVDIMFDGYLVTPLPGSSHGMLQCASSIAMVKTMIDDEVSYKLAITLPSLLGEVTLQLLTFTKYTGTDINTPLTKNGYTVTDSRAFKIPGDIAAVVSVDLGDKDSFTVVAKKYTGELTSSTYETEFTVNKVIGMVDYTAWCVSVDNALIDIEVLKNFPGSNDDPATSEFGPNMSSTVIATTGK